MAIPSSLLFYISITIQVQISFLEVIVLSFWRYNLGMTVRSGAPGHQGEQQSNSHPFWGWAALQGRGYWWTLTPPSP